MDEFFKYIFELIRTRWHRRSTIVILLLFLTAALLGYFTNIDIGKISLIEIAIIVLALVAATFIWLITNRIPRNPKDKIGFGISIVYENRDQQKQIATDFIDTLRNLLQQSKLKYHFEFIVFREHISEKINLETAPEYMKKARLHFLVFGRVRTRQIKGTPHHVLDLEGLVTHKPIQSKIHKKFEKEFSDLFPKKLIIASEGDIFSFEFTAQWVNIVSRYIMGIASLLSGDYEYSRELLEYLNEKIKNIKTDVSPIVKIRNRTPRLLVDIYLAYAKYHYEQWVLTRDSEPLDKLKIFVDKLEALAPTNYEGNILRSIWLFLEKREIDSAIAEIQRSRNRKDILWRYNLAFLLVLPEFVV